MKNFEFKNPTKIIFGENKISQISKEIPKDKRVLILYGGGSIKNNGIYDKVIEALSDHIFYEFGGITSNPEYSILLKALELIKSKEIDYLLAVGGGSVIDGTKFLSAAVYFDKNEPWDILSKNIPIKKGLPFGTILTLPATGSEMNSGAVISRASTKEKLVMGSNVLYPQFSILDPTVIKSIPRKYLVNGIIDSMVHVFEQYMTFKTDSILQERFAESILSTLIEIAPKLVKNPDDYSVASNFMWSCTMALNGLIQLGVPTDWTIHMIGHELTALYGIDHARSLAIILQSHYEYNFETKKHKLAQYAERVWNISEGSLEDKAHLAIKKTVNFFHSLDVKTKLSEYTNKQDEAPKIISDRFKERNWLTLGENKNIGPKEVNEIVKMSL